MLPVLKQMTTLPEATQQNNYAYLIQDEYWEITKSGKGQLCKLTLTRFYYPTMNFSILVINHQVIINTCQHFHVDNDRSAANLECSIYTKQLSFLNTHHLILSDFDLISRIAHLLSPFFSFLLLLFFGCAHTLQHFLIKQLINFIRCI